MSADTKANVEAAAARVAAAKAEFEAAKLAHARAFRKALVALCNEHGFEVGLNYARKITPAARTIREDEFDFLD